MEQNFQTWQETARRLVRQWDLYERMVEATSFEEYLAGDLPKMPPLATVRYMNQQTEVKPLAANGVAAVSVAS